MCASQEEDRVPVFSHAAFRRRTAGAGLDGGLCDAGRPGKSGQFYRAASTGCDAQPYFRIFNPWLQQQKFDPECHYIYRWIPELKGMSTNIIHNWPIKHLDGLYPKPMVDHARESQIAKERYKNL